MFYENAVFMKRMAESIDCGGTQARYISYGMKISAGGVKSTVVKELYNCYVQKYFLP